MFSTALWTGILFFTIYKTGQKLGKIEDRKNYLHMFFLWLFLMMFSTSFKMLGWTIGNSQDIEKYFYIPVGVIPAWLNLTMWGLVLFFWHCCYIPCSCYGKKKRTSKENIYYSTSYILCTECI